jgi:hypothetical protein
MQTRTFLTAAPCLLAIMLAQPAQAQTRPGDHRSVSRTVAAGAKTKIWMSWNLRPDCVVVPGFNVKVTALPASGSVTLEKTPEIVTESWATNIPDRERLEIIRGCLGKKVLTIGVFYTSKTRTPGNDAVSLIITDPSQSRQRSIDIAITIQ